jgi:hypothetical protein
MRKIKAPTTLVRVSKNAQKHMDKVKRNTDMSVREQVDEMIVLRKWILDNQKSTIGLGKLKSSYNRCLKEHKRDKVAFGHSCEVNEKGYCDTCGKIIEKEFADKEE